MGKASTGEGVTSRGSRWRSSLWRVTLAILVLLLVAGAASGQGPDTSITMPRSGAIVAVGQPVGVSGTAAGPNPINRVRVAVKNLSTTRWLRLDGTWGAKQYHLAALTLSGGTGAVWQFTFRPPSPAQYRIEAEAGDVSGAVDSTKPWVKISAATSVPSVTPTRTATRALPTPSRTATVSATSTRTASMPPTPTRTAVPPTATATIAPPVPPSATPTSTPRASGDAPQASFEVDASAGPAPHVVQFTDTSSGSIDTWLWEFGDGGVSSMRNPLHSFLQPGTYTVRLTVSGPLGSHSVTVAGAVAVSPTLAPSSAAFAEFVAYCPFSHRLADDPIVFPGQPGVAHMHSFFGSTVVDAFSTAADLLAGGTTCDPLADRSAYWVPTLWEYGVPVEPEQATFYYFVGTAVRTKIRPFPLGLRVIAGNGSRSGPTDGPSRYKWSCRGDGTSSTGDFAICPQGHELELLLNFPDCWNGSDLDSPNHQSHMTYSAAGQCPATHPVPVPQLQFKLRYPTSGSAGLSLSVGSGDHAHTDGRGWTAHGDFFNAWEPAAQRARIENCLYAGVKCAANGLP